MPDRRRWSSAFILKLLTCALALAACAAPAAAPTSTPTRVPTATALPPTAAPTAASTAVISNVPVPAITFRLLSPNDVAFDADGNLYVSNCGEMSQVLKIDVFGKLSVVAGQLNGFSGDGGPAVAAEFNCATGAAFDRDGNLYVADHANNRIRKVDRGGLISTVAGSGPTDSAPGAFGGDGGPATAAVLNLPNAIAFDPDGNLYIADAGNNRIRKVDPQGMISTFAGTGTAGFSGDGGPAIAAEINTVSFLPRLALDAAGSLYITDCGNGRVRKIDRQGIITTVAGDGGDQISGDGGPALSATLGIPSGLAFDAQGNLYVANTASSSTRANRIRKIDPNGIITTVAGNDSFDFPAEDVPATESTISGLGGLAFDREGNLFYADLGNNLVRKIDKYGVITAVAGTGY